MIFEIVQVKTYNGYMGEERPLSFVFRGQEIKVEQVVDRWYSAGMHPWQPRYDYFKVFSCEQGHFILRYNRKQDVWSVLIG